MATLLKILVWLMRIVVFIGLFGLAIKNSGPVELRFFFEKNWSAPLSVVILATFATGVVIGLTAALSVSIRSKKREPTPHGN